MNRNLKGFQYTISVYMSFETSTEPQVSAMAGGVTLSVFCNGSVSQPRK